MSLRRRPPFIMAHRGSSERCPENTLASFRAAVEEGADIVETDVRVAGDGTFVCIHDATVERTTGGSGSVDAMSLGQLQSLDASQGRAGFAGERIPTIAQAASVLPPAVMLAAELKSDEFIDPHVTERLLDELAHLGMLGRTMFLSFRWDRLVALHRLAPDVPTGLLSLSRLLPHPGTRLLGPSWWTLRANIMFIRTAHRRGQLVCPLDPTPEPRLAWYLRIGCDAVLTDAPGRTREAVEDLLAH